MIKKLKNSKGITLIALVITIIVLLILAGVAISMLSGENGILKQAAEAKKKTEEKTTEEQMKLAAMDALIEGIDKTSIESQGDLEDALEAQGIKDATVTPVDGGYKVVANGVTQIISNKGKITKVLKVIDSQEKVLSLDKNIQVEDNYGNKIIVPAGFKITKDADTVPEGIVIEDESAGNVRDTTTGETTNPTKGSQFVWIPVGKVYTTTDEEKTSENTKVVTLGRYSWSGNTGTPVQTVTTEAKAISAASATVSANSKYYEITPDNTKYPQSTYKNARAKSLEGFLKSAVKNGGYYIARYEAGIDGTTDNYSASIKKAVDGTVKPQSKQGLGVWNYIKQTDASVVSQAMYTNSNFTSDLINSYAWDTAIIFIQKMSGKNDYASQSSLNSGSPTTTGTSGDVQYNIYDMASNVREYSTETYSSSSYPCVLRGGNYNGSDDYTSTRVLNSVYANKIFGFRPLLYVGLNSNSD